MFSPQCALIEPGLPEEEYPSSPIPPGSVAEDLLDAIPVRTEAEQEPTCNQPQSFPNLSSSEGLYNDLDYDNHKMYYNSSTLNLEDSNQSSFLVNSSTRNSVVPGVIPAKSSIDTRNTALPTSQYNTAVNTFANSRDVNLESGYAFTVPPDFGKSDHCFTSANCWESSDS